MRTMSLHLPTSSQDCGAWLRHELQQLENFEIEAGPQLSLSLGRARLEQLFDMQRKRPEARLRVHGIYSFGPAMDGMPSAIADHAAPELGQAVYAGGMEPVENLLLLHIWPATAESSELLAEWENQVDEAVSILVQRIGERWPAERARVDDAYREAVNRDQGPADAAAGTGVQLKAELAESEERGAKAGTLERVRLAHQLLKTRRYSQARVWKRAHTDSRTYQRWCKAATGEDPIMPGLPE